MGQAQRWQTDAGGTPAQVSGWPFTRTYDAAGNLANDGRNFFRYDGSNRLKDVYTVAYSGGAPPKPVTGPKEPANRSPARGVKLCIMQAPDAISLPLLDRLQIASPCSARWEEMSGDERSRHCAACDRSVYNLSGMGRAEAEAFLQTHLEADGQGAGGRVCTRFYRRADGTILTADCPVGLAAVRARARRTVARVAAAIGLTTLVAWAAARETHGTPLAYTQPLATIAGWLRQPLTPPPTSPMMGKVAVMRPTPIQLLGTPSLVHQPPADAPAQPGQPTPGAEGGDR